MGKLQESAGSWTAGETFQALAVDYGDYSTSNGYEVTAKFSYQSQATLTADGVDTSDLWNFTIPFADTENLEPGVYQYVVYATADGVRTAIDNGRIKVFANPAAVYSDATLLAAIRAQLSSSASTEQRTTKIGDVELQFMGSSELFKAEQHYEQRLSRRRRRDEMQRGRCPNTILSEYKNP